ncbi:MAG TPA: hypothetical protein VIY52_15740 [Streptosporangiaceae bacterium]
MNRSLRALVAGLLHRPYSMNQASYDLARLARNGLIARVPGRGQARARRWAMRQVSGGELVSARNRP